MAVEFEGCPVRDRNTGEHVDVPLEHVSPKGDVIPVIVTASESTPDLEKQVQGRIIDVKGCAFDQLAELFLERPGLAKQDHLRRCKHLNEEGKPDCGMILYSHPPRVLPTI